MIPKQLTIQTWTPEAAPRSVPPLSPNIAYSAPVAAPCAAIVAACRPRRRRFKVPALPVPRSERCARLVQLAGDSSSMPILAGESPFVGAGSGMFSAASGSVASAIHAPVGARLSVPA
jgi:hypothetical protein